ncbi:MAG: hypothetical protein HOV82_34250 [Streptomyces sp.]|nr:hypothetical protein [Streptomyces sp.]NUS23298.1 hypothetical protein [Streptomyces sp.]NUS80408.1 hypothetical protein [Streptomyces sp.]
MRWRRAIASVVLWWAGLTLLLWLGGRAAGQPTVLARCAASAVLLVAVGEAGDWLRRRWRAYRRSRSTRLPPA